MWQLSHWLRTIDLQPCLGVRKSGFRPRVLCELCALFFHVNVGAMLVGNGTAYFLGTDYLPMEK